MLRPIKAEHRGEGIVLVCFHWRDFPAALAEKAKAQNLDPDDVQMRQVLGQTGFQQYEVWKRVCGQMEMTPEVCLQCEHAGKLETREGVPSMISLDDKRVIPTTDIPTLDMISHRGRSGHRSIHQGDVKRGTPSGRH